MEYTHAKDYLIELANKLENQGWLKDLIIKIINFNGNISDTELSESTLQLKSNNASTLTIPKIEASNNHSDIKLVSLTHHSGVCALAEDQKIVFSDDMTLLYGKNGSGKSSYFRILNEMIGGNHQIEIRPNIYANTNQPINIELEYSEGSKIKNILWNGSNRAIIPLNLSSVFDSSYTMTFLEKRSADTTIILPYGLHLFTALTTTMNKIKEKIQTEIDESLSTLPQIDMNGLSEDVIAILTQRTYNSKQKNYIETKYEFTDKQKANLEQQENQLKVIKETNFNDKINLTSNEQSQYISLKKHIVNTKNNLQKYQEESKIIIQKIRETRNKNEDIKHRIAILNEIGNTDSIEWKKFIEIGATYIGKSDLTENICPYCRQPLINESINIVAAYAAYLSDNSLIELNTLLKKKKHLEKNISTINTDYTITEQFKLLLDTKQNNSELFIKVSALLHKQTELKTTILNNLKKEQDNNFNTIDSTDKVISTLNTICEEYTNVIGTLHEKLSKKNETIQELSTKMKSLIEHQKLSQQKDLFIKWFEEIEHINNLKECSKKISTRGISNLSKVANQTLVTENLKNKFQEELDELGLKKLSINLSDAGASKGQSFMQLKLVDNNLIKNVLSEGEQKGVALALFIAERRMQLSKNPIILDDPVNSLDHFITAKLVERLSKLGNQIIIFSHNLLLQTSMVNLRNLHECGINQRSSCRKQSKHLFMYSINSYGRNKKGVVIEIKQDNVANSLLNAHNYLNKIPFTNDCCISAGAIMRHTIELIIDKNIFHNQIPIKFHGKKNTIQWEELKSLNPDAEIIDKLNTLFSRLSGGDLHSGTEQSYNPIDHEELEDIYNELHAINNLS